jgi:hypothetical protein
MTTATAVITTHLIIIPLMVNGKISMVNLLHSGMTVSASTSFCLVKFFHYHEVTLLMLGNHHLGNAFAIVDNKIFL